MFARQTVEREAQHSGSVNCSMEYTQQYYKQKFSGLLNEPSREHRELSSKREKRRENAASNAAISLREQKWHTMLHLSLAVAERKDEWSSLANAASRVEHLRSFAGWTKL